MRENVLISKTLTYATLHILKIIGNFAGTLEHSIAALRRQTETYQVSSLSFHLYNLACSVRVRMAEPNQPILLIEVQEYIFPRTRLIESRMVSKVVRKKLESCDDVKLSQSGSENVTADFLNRFCGKNVSILVICNQLSKYEWIFSIRNSRCRWLRLDKVIVNTDDP